MRSKIIIISDLMMKCRRKKGSCSPTIKLYCDFGVYSLDYLVDDDPHIREHYSPSLKKSWRCRQRQTQLTFASHAHLLLLLLVLLCVCAILKLPLSYYWEMLLCHVHHQERVRQQINSCRSDELPKNGLSLPQSMQRNVYRIHFMIVILHFV